MPEELRDEHLRELDLLYREYDATLKLTTDPDEQLRLRRILAQLRANIVLLERQ